jgi:hypothetical protein
MQSAQMALMLVRPLRNIVPAILTFIRRRQQGREWKRERAVKNTEIWNCLQFRLQG